MTCPTFSSSVRDLIVSSTHTWAARSSVNGSRGAVRAAEAAQPTISAAAKTPEHEEVGHPFRRIAGCYHAACNITIEPTRERYNDNGMRASPVAEHKGLGPRSVRCFVLTVSDTRTEDTDTSGRAIVELLTDSGHVVSGRAIVKDDPELVRDAVRRQLADAEVRAIFTTGGTGITSRDSTYEAVNA